LTVTKEGRERRGRVAPSSHPPGTSRLLGQLFEKLRGEGLALTFTMEDFNRQYIKEHFALLTPEDQREALERLSPEHRRELLQVLLQKERLAGLSEEQVRQLLDQLAAGLAAYVAAEEVTGEQ
jgi:hypothetical protein